MGLIFTFVAVFLLYRFIIFGVGLPAFLSNHNQFSSEHIFVGFIEFSSLDSVLMHCHLLSPATGAYSFLKSEMGFYVCAV